jgi:nucleotide-binding universal stress UspA family protein
MKIRSILVATDLSVQENLAVRRACRLADAHRATVNLMYMPQHGQDVASQAATRLADIRRRIEDQAGLRVRAVPVKAKPDAEDLVAAARGVDLVVLPHRRERSTAAFFRGQPVLRLLRRCDCPVLIARRHEREHYARILVATDLSPRAEALLELATHLDPRAQLQVFHAASTLGEARLRSAEATEQAVRAYRRRVQRDAEDRMRALAGRFERHGNVLSTVIGRGDPGWQAVLQQERSDAELVVIGKTRASAWEDFLCGSAAHRVLSWGRGDVLVVPMPYAPATAPVAARRINRVLAAPSLPLRPAERRPS